MSSQHNFSGIWRNTYWFPSNTHEGEDTSEYIVNVHQHGDKLTVVSLPNAIEAHMTVNLTVDGKLATGTWIENTSPDGEFEAMTYSGALQLLVGDDGKHMDGQWVGVGREKLADGSYEPRIYNGRWQLLRIKDMAIPKADTDDEKED
jgi:hypothetical protein